MTDERLSEIEALARQYGSANCWTGSSSLWTIPMLELVNEVKRLQDLTAELSAAIRDAHSESEFNQRMMRQR